MFINHRRLWAKNFLGRASNGHKKMRKNNWSKCVIVGVRDEFPFSLMWKFVSSDFFCSFLKLKSSCYANYRMRMKFVLFFFPNYFIMVSYIGDPRRLFWNLRRLREKFEIVSKFCLNSSSSTQILTFLLKNFVNFFVRIESRVNNLFDNILVGRLYCRKLNGILQNF